VSEERAGQCDPMQQLEAELDAVRESCRRAQRWLYEVQTQRQELLDSLLERDIQEP
jgi:hypothetical protein